MEAFFAALISGVMAWFINDRQHDQNIQDWERQNTYNENMYNQYNSPQSRARQLREAGMSDAGIGSALSGVGGSSPMIYGSPMQPTNINDGLNSAFGSIMDSLRVHNETEINKAEVKLKGIENGIKGKELEYWEKAFEEIVSKPFNENQKLAAEAYLINEKGFGQNIENSIQDLELKVSESTKNVRIETIKLEFDKKAAEIGLTEAQAKQAYENTLYLIAKRNEINQLTDVREREAAEARFYKEFMEKIGIPYDSVKDLGEFVNEIIKTILNTFGLKSLI